MYVLRVRRGEDRDPAGDGNVDHTFNCDYEIFNQDGELIAMSTCISDSASADQMRFLDAQGNIITVAQSPAIEGGYIPFQLSDYYGPKVPWHVPAEGEKDTRHVPGFLQPWDIWFVDGEPGHPSNSSLLLAQNRWVVAAAIVDRALRDAWEDRWRGPELAPGGRRLLRWRGGPRGGPRAARRAAALGRGRAARPDVPAGARLGHGEARERGRQGEEGPRRRRRGVRACRRPRGVLRGGRAERIAAGPRGGPPHGHGWTHLGTLVRLDPGPTL
ncbi:unnamed protein product [Prorocentrum cordatum]|uniref:Uncharacterized protein n=1 Tax=Prorocentrum cordatum TaxID=2364126 RepID=A0ABN9Q030_9DINO|nr:unnamed protein product [Polarella glacialis]